MREILFRGKRLDNGGWVEGYLCKTVMHLETFHQNVVVDCIEVYDGESYLNIVFRNVSANSIGQFTGLRDKNGKKIFEGDILKRTNGNKYVWYVDYKNCAFCANQSNCNYACELGELLDQIELEVIGNIHDNPELLEG